VQPVFEAIASSANCLLAEFRLRERDCIWPRLIVMAWASGNVSTATMLRNWTIGHDIG
jgi:hypothetical protein